MRFSRAEWEIGMIPKISIAAAFLLMTAPPMTCASTRDAAGRAPVTRHAQSSPLDMVLAQDDSPSMGTTNNDSDSSDSSDNDNDSDSADDNQNADGNQADQNAAGDEQSIPPTVLGAPDSDSSDAQQSPQTNSYPQPVNPYQ
jgi:hypothetical protein